MILFSISEADRQGVGLSIDAFYERPTAGMPMPVVTAYRAKKKKKNRADVGAAAVQCIHTLDTASKVKPLGGLENLIGV